MPRPATISDDTILQAAREIFLEHGAGATTSAVAERAGISEGSIFKRFRTKDALFQHAMQVTDPGWLVDIERRVGTATVREHLIQLGAQGIELFRREIPLHMMSWSNPEASALARKKMQKGTPPAIRGAQKLAAYFAAEMELGRIKESDPQILARCFGGSLYQFAAFEVMFGAAKLMPMPADEYVLGLVDLIWAGVAPKERRRTNIRGRAIY